MKNLLLLFPVTIALVGCSTNPATNPTTVAPALYSTASANSVPVKITRDSGIVGSACAINVSVDEKQVGKLRSSESVSLFVPPGRHILSIATAGICGGARDAIDVTLKQNEPKNYRIGVDMGGNVQLLPTL